MTIGGRITLHSNKKNNGYLKNRFSDSKVIRKPLTPDTLLSACTPSPSFQKRRRLRSDKRKRNRKVKNELKEYNLITHYKKDSEIANKCHRMQNVNANVQKAEKISLPYSEELQIKVNSSKQFPNEYLLPINLQKNEPSSVFSPLQKYDDVGRKCTTKKEKYLTIPFNERQKPDCIGLQDKTTNSSFLKPSTSVSEAQESHGLKEDTSLKRVTKSFESCKKNLPLLFSIDDKAEKSSNLAMDKRLQIQYQKRLPRNKTLETQHFKNTERSYANQKSIEAKKTQIFRPIRCNEHSKGTTDSKPMHFKSNRSLFTTPKRDNIERVFSVLSPRCQSAPPFPIKNPIEFSDKFEEKHLFEELNLEVPSKSLIPQNNNLESEVSNVIPSKNEVLECNKSCVNNYDSEPWSPTKFLIKCVKQSTNETEKNSIDKQGSQLEKPKSSPNLRKSSDRKAKTKALILLKQTTSKRSVRSKRKPTVENGLYEVMV
ncbi:hypothetical protein TNIN_114761 [Trichonephila inaurata madagascariensis]|uniref:Uncharacterized protein n=1 Tax=Trichonephila inaurata madagascariensis TaxID=2747483 RepID=A0A8X6XGI9_9ARAC|nr:hypothetical protein TNIN_114761 [Trichonephila inaurata madagascariensis]